MDTLRELGTKALPTIDGTVAAKGIRERVEIIRDRWGVPHIYASNAEDLFFAQGYVHAQDRLWQMETRRRASSGRLSDIWGASSLAADRWSHILGNRRRAETAAADLDSEYKPLIEAYVRGVNEFIATHQNCLPLEFHILDFKPEPWTPADVCGGGGAISLPVNGSRELLRARFVAELGLEMANRLLPVDPPAEVAVPDGVDYDWMSHQALTNLSSLGGASARVAPHQGSNNWLVGGAKSATGKPILASDAHLQLAHPQVWYEVHLVGGEYNVTGISSPSGPGIFIGWNDHIAWGATTANIDACDLFMEKINPDNPYQYLFKGEWRAMELAHEEIRVRDGETVHLEVRLTHHGPIVYEDEKTHQALAACTTGMEPAWGTPSVLALNKARNWPEFVQALGKWAAVGQNFIFADKEDNIGYIIGGKMPIRPKGTGLLPVPGWTGEYDWQGIYPIEENPQTFNPPEGFIATANNNTLPEGYPHLVSHEWDAGFRAARIKELLRAREKLSVEDLARIQSDYHSIPARRIVPRILAVEPGIEIGRRAQECLRGWDYDLQPKSAAAAIYEVFYVKMLRNTFAERLGEERYQQYLDYGNFHMLALLDILEEPDTTWFADNEERRRAISRSLDEAALELQQRVGDNLADWRWGKLHLANWVHRLGRRKPHDELFNLKPVERGGDGFTVNNTGYFYRQPYNEASSASFRQVVDLAEPANSISIGVSGQSGLPFSAHFGDIVDLWASGRYHPTLWRRQDVEANAEGKLVLTP